MSSDRNDGYAKVINALTAAVITFKDKDLDLYKESKDALESVLREVGWRTLGEVSSITGDSISEVTDDRTPLIPWIPKVRLVADLEELTYKIFVDDVDLNFTYSNRNEADIAYWAAQATVERMRKYNHEAALSFHQLQARD